MYFELDTLSTPKYAGSARRWRLRIRESATGTSADTVFTVPEYEMPETRYRMQISGSEIRYYRNYTGPGSEPLYRSTIPAISYPVTFAISNVVLTVLSYVFALLG